MLPDLTFVCKYTLTQSARTGFRSLDGQEQRIPFMDHRAWFDQTLSIYCFELFFSELGGFPHGVHILVRPYGLIQVHRGLVHNFGGHLLSRRFGDHRGILISVAPVTHITYTQITAHRRNAVVIGKIRGRDQLPFTYFVTSLD